MLELLLNLLWLMLLLPAAWIWQRRQEQAALKSLGSLSGFRSFVLLGFIVVLLFPIISITDDLHPMRADVEESSPSKRIAKLLTAAKTPAWNHHSAPPAQIVALFTLRFSQTASEVIPSYQPAFSIQPQGLTLGSRAPPSC